MTNSAYNNYKKAIEAKPENGYEISPQVTEWLSDDSVEVMEHFGLEAPVLLNNYACAVEDALIEQVKKNSELQQQVEAATELITDALRIARQNGFDLEAELRAISNEKTSS
jgi:predicted glycosyltransferase